jgi:hypothetical protein
MYVLDPNKRSEGVQLLTLSYSQYKDLEERKLQVWKKLLQQNPKCPCPISSVADAYLVEITRKEENKKTTYSFNVDVLSGTDALTEEEIQALLDTPRIPDTQYRYNRFHLEATIEYLKQYDAKMEMDVMSSKEIEEAITKISMELPADDKSHFSFDKKDRNGEGEESDDNSLDGLWSRYEKLEERGIGDKSDEGQELRDAIRDFIDDNDLAIRVTRGKTNKDLLYDIEDALEAAKSSPKHADDEAEDDTNEPEPEEDDADDASNDDNDGASDEPEEDDEEPATPRSRRRGEHNDDTNEPAVTGSRRQSRPERRRR